MNYPKGLEGVIAGETAISNVEGDIRRLSYRGYAIEDLVRQDYMAVMWLVLFGELPDEAQRTRLASYLAANGELQEQDISLLDTLPDNLHPMKMPQSMIPVTLTGQDAFENLDEEGIRGLQIVAKLPALISTFYRIKSAAPPTPRRS